MIDLSPLPYKKIAVLGLARSGLATLSALKSANISYSAWDDNEEKRALANEQGFTTTSLQDGFLDDADLLVISPGIPHIIPTTHPVTDKARELNIPVTVDIQLFAEARDRDKTKLIAITGTNGKSTTTALLMHVLNAKGKTEAGGNFGVPALSLSNDCAYAVLELSSYQTEVTSALSADAVIWLNITPDHIDRHGDINGYVEAKKRIFETDAIDGLAVIGIDDEHSLSVAEDIDEAGQWTVLPVSIGKKNDIGVTVESSVLYDNGVEKGTLKDAQTLKGEHNHQNAACVYAIAKYKFHMSPETIFERFNSFGGLTHRQFFLGTKGAVTYINDSKATNANATEKALKSFDNIIWLAGGVAKEGGISDLKDYFSKIKYGVFYGQAGKEFLEYYTSQGGECVYVETLDEAVDRAQNYAEKNKETPLTVLLSPACASFDQYGSYEKRGEHFEDLVEKIK